MNHSIECNKININTIQKEVTEYLESMGIPRPEQTNAYRMEIAYRLGYIDALRNYAIWKDGEQRIGAMSRLIKDIIDDFKNKEIPLRY